MLKQARLPIVALFAASPVMADVSPSQVWDDLEAYLQSFGYSVTATESLAGEMLTVSDVAFAMDMPDDGGSFSMGISEITLQDQGDGSVRVTFPASMPMAMTFVPEPGEAPVSLKLDYTQSNLEMIVSGEPDAFVYAYTADALGLKLTEMRTKGVILTEEIARFSADMGPVEGRSAMTLADGLRNFDQTTNMGTLTYDWAFKDPESDEGAATNGTMSGLVFAGTGAFPVAFDAEDPLALFTAGLAMDGTFSHQGGQAAFMISTEEGVTNGTSSSRSGTLGVTLNQESVRYTTSGTGTKINMTVPEFPFPIDAEMARAGFELLFPLSKSDTPQDALFKISFGDFEMADMLWGLFDPGEQLPRDPATIEIDLSAKVTPFVSLFDEDAMAALDDSGDMPGELNALTLNNLRVDAVGGLITGDGAFTFDNADLESFDGFPAPEGKLNLSVSGANTLIDKLIAMGFMAEEDAMGARMMMSMFTVPGEAPDSMTSVIEVNDKGHVLANGQRIR